jgi:hypothetical protein
LLVQLACEDSTSLLQLADEEALLVHIVYIVSTYFVFFYLLTNDGELRLIVTPRVCSVTCEVDGVEIWSSLCLCLATKREDQLFESLLPHNS